ncbi:MAG TPA: hypothetical protein VGA00_14595 [Acidiferrobacterales bacterium]
MNARTYLSCLLVGMSAAAGLARADEVTLPYKGLTLNAELELVAGKKLADGVVLITHGGLAHRGMESIVYIQELLKERGNRRLPSP